MPFLSASDKENRPPSSLDSEFDRRLPEANRPNQNTPESANEADPILPNQISYPDFLKLFTDPEQRADLHDELKEENHQSTLVTLLGIFHQTFAMEQNATHTRLLSTFTEGRLSWLADDIGHYTAIVASGQNRLPILLQNFAQYTRATNSVAKLVTNGTLETALSYHEIRRQIFDLALVIGLMYAGERTFVRHG